MQPPGCGLAKVCTLEQNFSCNNNIMGEVLALTALVGAGISAGASAYSQHKQSKAARQASRAATEASKASVVTQTNTAAAPTTTTAQASEEAMQKKARKRMSMSDTVNTFSPAGLRNTLG